MLSTLIEARKNGTRLRRDHDCFMVIAGERPDGVKRVELHDGDELCFTRAVPAKKLDASKSRNRMHQRFSVQPQTFCSAKMNPPSELI